MNMRPYRSAIDRLQFSETEKNRMTDHLMEAQTTRSAVRRSFRRIPIAGLAAALCLTVTAGAYALQLASDAFAPVYGYSHSALIDELGAPIGVHDRSKGYTLTADAIIGDQYNALIAFSISKNDGGVFAPEIEGLSARTDVSTNVMGGSHGTCWFADADTSDDQIEFYYSIHQDNGIQGSAITAELSDLHHIDWDTGETTSLIDGSWKVRFKADYADSMISLEAGQVVEDDCGLLELTEVAISPVGFNIVGEYDAGNGTEAFFEVTEGMGIDVALPEAPENTDLTEWEGTVAEYEYDGAAASAPRPDEIVLKLRDGTVLDLASGSGYTVSWEEDRLQIMVANSFDQIIAFDEMESLTINGYTWEIPAQN